MGTGQGQAFPAEGMACKGSEMRVQEAGECV